MDVCHGLRFYALCRINYQQRALASSETTRNFIREIDVPGRVEQIQPICFAVFTGITHRHWMRLDGDTALPLQVHRIKKLILPLALLDGASALQ